MICADRDHDLLLASIFSSNESNTYLGAVSFPSPLNATIETRMTAETPSSTNPGLYTPSQSLTLVTNRRYVSVEFL
jgi:hypothetical protein